jgi:hypothetical protein
MKRLLALLISCSCIQAKSIVTDDLVDKFAIIESNYNYEAVGDKGKAFGAWQMHKFAVIEGYSYLTKDVKSKSSRDSGIKEAINNWKSYAKHPFLSKEIATSYMQILENQMLKEGVKPTPIKLYMAWNMGFTGARSHRFNYESYSLDNKRTSILRRANQILSR